MDIELWVCTCKWLLKILYDNGHNVSVWIWECSNVQVHCVVFAVHSCISYTLSMSQPNTTLKCTFSIERLENCVHTVLLVVMLSTNTFTCTHNCVAFSLLTRNSTQFLEAGFIYFYLFLTIHNHQMVFAMPKFNAHTRKKQERTT